MNINKKKITTMIPFFNIIMIDLTIFNNEDEIKDFLSSCGLLDKIDYKNMWQCIKGEFTSGSPIVRIWFDAKTFGVVAYSLWNSQDFTTEFVDFLKNMSPIQYGQKIETEEQISEVELNVDSILDKIRTKGLESLTIEEKNFLDSQN
jgi:hypothetical protein